MTAGAPLDAVLGGTTGATYIIGGALMWIRRRDYLTGFLSMVRPTRTSIPTIGSPGPSTAQPEPISWAPRGALHNRIAVASHMREARPRQPPPQWCQRAPDITT